MYEQHNGKLFELLGEFDPRMEEHVRKALIKEEVKATYLEKTIQNEIIELFNDKIMCHIFEVQFQVYCIFVIYDFRFRLWKREHRIYRTN